jgi:hypothetical protein
MAPSMATVGSVSLVFVIAAAANGCADHFFPEVGRQVPRPELGVQAEPRTSSRSDRLRGGLAQASPLPQVPKRSAPTADKPTPARPTADPLAPARPPEPARPQDRTQPQQPARPSEGAPSQGRDEPDPRTVIDWLLKDRR